MPTLLLLDDDRVFRRILSAALQRRGYKVVEAGRASEANVLIEGSNPDLLLVDGLLPDATGVSWIEGLRARGRKTPVIFVSSFWKSMPDFLKVTRTLGDTQLLSKPVLPDAVADRVDLRLGRIDALPGLAADRPAPTEP